ncbi:MAG: hypothetical protein KDA21_12300, partial [Phycisphaerales bacterium]|nr:hypothetical protein [Phycisphaerales bacterium]
VVLGYNDLGMHCMNEDYADLMILPPYNTLRTQILERRDSPEFITGDHTVTYSVPTQHDAADRTIFWSYVADLLGVALPTDVGLTGNALTGQMHRVSGKRYWEASGIPVTPFDDFGRLNTYPLARVDVVGQAGAATTATVIPVSGELNCNLCHQAAGISVGMDILQDHDRLHGTDLQNNRPVLCASCHADPALGAPGVPGVSALSHAIHGAHADRVGELGLDNECYSCHPGLRTQCQRDVHFLAGIDCNACHGGMADVGNPARTPWVQEPRCGDCHVRPGFEFEQPDTLYKDSVGHRGVSCFTCHGSPHAIGPAAAETDNLQPIRLQGHEGVINECSVCHSRQPEHPFFHRVGEDD